MANSKSNNNQALQVLRGTRSGIIENKEMKLLPGQPIYNETDNYLTIGSASGNKTIDSMPIAVRELKGYFADNLSSSGKLAETLDENSPKFWIKGVNTGTSRSNRNKLDIFSNEDININAEKDIYISSTTGSININADTVAISGMSGSESGEGSLSLAEIITKVNNNESNIKLLTSNIVGDFETLATWPDDPLDLDPNKIYYTLDDKTYHYYKDGDWQSTTSLSEAGLNGTIAVIELRAKDNLASIDALTKTVYNNGTAIAGFLTSINNLSGEITAKLSAQKTELTGLIDGAKNTLAETINEVHKDGTALAGQLVSQISNFVFLEDFIWQNGKDADGNDLDEDKIYKALKEQGSQKYYYYYYKDGNWNETDNPKTAGCTVTSAGIITSINSDGDSSMKINADRVNLIGYATFESLKTPGATEIDGGNIITLNLKLISSNITNLDDSVTEISNGWIKTVDITAENLKVNAANVTNLTANNIIVSDTSRLDKELEALNAEKNKAVVETHIYYGINESSSDYSDIIDWQEGILLEPNADNECLWQKISKIYNNGSIDETYLCLGKNNSATIVEISSISGDKIVAGELSITLIARAVKGGFDITDNYPDAAFTWTKYDIHGQSTSWSHVGKEILVGCDDIIKKAVFNCELDLDKEIKK